MSIDELEVIIPDYIPWNDRPIPIGPLDIIGSDIVSHTDRIDELQRKLDDLTLKLQALINMLPDNDINVEELL